MRSGLFAAGSNHEIRDLAPMKLSAQSALLRGSDYHHAVAWLWACRMLLEPAEVLSVAVEDSDGGAFDDVVVRRDRGRDVYIQCKSSNYSDVIIDEEWLLSSGSQSGISPLQRFYRTYANLNDRGSGSFLLELWTNRGFDHQHPLLGGLLDAKHNRINVGRASEAGSRSRTGKTRDCWASHLGIPKGELAQFLETVTWKHTGSELDLRDQARPLMRLAGLRDDHPAVSTGIGIVREWVTDGLGPQTADHVGRSATEMGLVPTLFDIGHETDDVVEELQMGLPPTCVVHLKLMQRHANSVSVRTTELLSRDVSRTPGVLAREIEGPPDWLAEAGHGAWDAIAGFLSAHELPGADRARKYAIERQSPYSELHRIHDAFDVAEAGDVENACEILDIIPEDQPIRELARSHVNGDADGVVAISQRTELSRSSNAQISITSSLMLVGAYRTIGQFEEAIGILDYLRGRFRDRGSIALHQAVLKIELAAQSAQQRVDRPDLLESAVELGLAARDLYRAWDGPSARAVAIAAQALLMLDEPQQVCELATVSPAGQATPKEASDASVINYYAHALIATDNLAEIDNLDFDQLGVYEETFLKAIRAHSGKQSNARELMQHAISLAKSDEEQLMAMRGLALFGEHDAQMLAEIDSARPADIALISALAKYHRGGLDAAISELTPYQFNSQIHAEFAAQILHEKGESKAAVELLSDAAAATGSGFLYVSAVRLLMRLGQLTEAEDLALTALAGSLSMGVERRLRLAHVEIANQTREWARMEDYGRALLLRFPEVPMAPWAVINALVFQAKFDEARKFIVEHPAFPIDEATASLAVQVYGAVGALEADFKYLLNIADEFAGSELVAGQALIALMTKGDDAQISEEDRRRLQDRLDDFCKRFPESQILRNYSFSGPQEMLEFLEQSTKPPSIEMAQAVNRVRTGGMPYGVLRFMRALPYAELLSVPVAEQLTAVSIDSDIRESERCVARSAISNAISVDSSVAAFFVLAGLNDESIDTQFWRIYVADELLTDARAAVLSAGMPITGFATHDPVFDQLSFIEPHEQRELGRNRTEAMLKRMLNWYSVPSANITAHWTNDGDHLRPWDASLRVALERGCALWCDDLALRQWAIAEGIPAFGTFALYEALVDADANGVRSLDAIKPDLLRSRISDIPMTWPELTDLANESSELDPAILRFLERPASWTSPRQMLEWCLDQFKETNEIEGRRRVVQLLNSASTGAGLVGDPNVANRVLVSLLAYSIARADDADVTPALLASSKYACRSIDPSGSLDVLVPAVNSVWKVFNSSLKPAEAAQTMVKLFATCDQAVRTLVAMTVFGPRDDLN